MNFIEIDNMLINLDNVTNIINFDKEFIRICFFDEKDFIDIPINDEKTFDKIWKSLKTKIINKKLIF